MRYESDQERGSVLRTYKQSKGTKMGGVATASGPASDCRAKVWIVDDDTGLLLGLRRVLQAAGFGVEIFESGESLLHAMDSPSPECLILDVHLGTMSGFDVQARLLAAGRSIPTIFMTGRDDTETRRRARRAGAAGYLPKPFDNEALVSAVRAALKRS